MDDIDVLLFDLGGVLVRVEGIERIEDWTAGKVGAARVWQHWLASPAVREFETGRSSPEAFAGALVSELGLDLDAGAFLDSFRGWIAGLYPGVPALLEGVRGRYRLASLSNTNALHWSVLNEDLGLGELLDEHFPSHHLGVLKPDPECFERVVSALGVPASRVLFLDDNAVNVDGARAVGLRAKQVKGADELRTVLHAL